MHPHAPREVPNTPSKNWRPHTSVANDLYEGIVLLDDSSATELLIRTAESKKLLCLLCALQYQHTGDASNIGKHMRTATAKLKLAPDNLQQE